METKNTLVSELVKNRLDVIVTRLILRETTLFQKIVFLIKSNEQREARMLANELYHVKELRNKLISVL